MKIYSGMRLVGMKLNSWFKNNYVLTIVLLIAAMLRFYHIDYQSVWLDEVHTLNEANPSLSLPELYNAVLQSDPHPPLYFILVHFIFQIFVTCRKYLHSQQTGVFSGIDADGGDWHSWRHLDGRKE